MTSKLFDLTGRTALVTGGSKGLGKAMATIFAEAGAAVVISSRHEDELQATAGEIQGRTAARVECVVADMTRREDVQRLAGTALAAMGRIDILVNNAGANVPQPIDQIRDEDWDRLVELNLTSCMALTRALAPGMKERRWGRIIHISSIMGLASTAGRNVYSATKSALLGLARASALDLGEFNITVNCIAPGPFSTDMPMSILTVEQQAALAGRTALNRWAQPEELAGPALLLAS
jgi:NAD(P)-dependent dehydrogenase (short-subunit alcohol dehydrogenase family)